MHGLTNQIAGDSLFSSEIVLNLFIDYKCYLIAIEQNHIQSVHFVFQGEAGKVGMPGFPGSDGVPVSREILTGQYIICSCLFKQETVELIKCWVHLLFKNTSGIIYN